MATLKTCDYLDAIIVWRVLHHLYDTHECLWNELRGHIGKEQKEALSFAQRMQWNGLIVFEDGDTYFGQVSRRCRITAVGRTWHDDFQGLMSGLRAG